METFKKQLEKSTEWQESVKQLQEETGKMAESDALKRAREVYTKAGASAGIQSERLRAATEELKKASERMGDSISSALEELEKNPLVKGINKTAGQIGSSIQSTTEPIRNTQAYKNLSSSVKQVVDNGTASRYGGFLEKEERRARRSTNQAGMQGYFSSKKVRADADPNAGENVVLHKDSAWKESWGKFKEKSPLMQGFFTLRRNYEESENPLISYSRAITDRVAEAFGRLTEENETAQVVKAVRLLDPSFRMDTFLRDLREYIIPEVIDAYLKVDPETLKIWCSEATYNVLTAGFKDQIQKGLVSDSKVLELRNLDVSRGKVLENDVPVFIITFNTQEIIVFRDAITGQVVYGDPDRIEQVLYVAAVTRVEEELTNETTGGWRIIEIGKHSSRTII